MRAQLKIGRGLALAAVVASLAPVRSGASTAPPEAAAPLRPDLVTLAIPAASC